jgi:hypothetical protein
MLIHIAHMLRLASRKEIYFYLDWTLTPGRKTHLKALKSVELMEQLGGDLIAIANKEHDSSTLEITKTVLREISRDKIELSTKLTRRRRK